LGFQEKAVKIREAVLDKNHPDFAQSYNNLSLIYKAQGQLESACQYGEKAVAILLQLFPNGHPNLDTAKENLENIKKEMEKA
jgi:tetratricopeptide (TPR) repeat protein